ncbi:MAG: NYN domain-containing protein [Verrucomicrobiaceae bacterium]|nr:NYN domain-containing protein [Verrucomicrobiaceae bacterium]
MNSLIFPSLGFCRSRVPQTRHAAKSPSRPALPQETDLSVFSLSRVIAIFDEDNLRISMGKEHHARLSYRLLYDKLVATSASLHAVAVLTDEPGRQQRACYLKNRGWVPLVIEREVVTTCHGAEVKSNADTDLAVEAGRLLSLHPCDVLCLGSGDGDLVLAIAKAVRRCWPQTKVVTVAVPGCTSARLRKHSELIHQHVPIGADITRSGGSRPRHRRIRPTHTNPQLHACHV